MVSALVRPLAVGAFNGGLVDVGTGAVAPNWQTNFTAFGGTTTGENVIFHPGSPWFTLVVTLVHPGWTRVKQNIHPGTSDQGDSRGHQGDTRVTTRVTKFGPRMSKAGMSPWCHPGHTRVNQGAFTVLTTRVNQGDIPG
jgi:hypothetical protein